MLLLPAMPKSGNSRRTLALLHPLLTQVLPVVCAAAGACCFGVFCLTRSMTRPDVVWTPGKQAEPWNNVSQKTNFKFFGHMPKTIVPDYDGSVDLRGKL